MEKPIVKIYIGDIWAWTKDLPKDAKGRQSLCGKRLLCHGLYDMGYGQILGGGRDIYEDVKILEKLLEKGVHGKPYFKDYPGVQFNISHSGKCAVCALSSVSVGVDIQEIRPFSNKRLLLRTMSVNEQEQILNARDMAREFSRLWAFKESCLKLTGEGITRPMQEIEPPLWQEFFWPEETMAGSVCANKICKAVFEKVEYSFKTEG